MSKPRLLQSERELSNPAEPIHNRAQAKFVAELREIGAARNRRLAEETNDPHERTLLLAQAEAYAATAAGIRAKLEKGTPPCISTEADATTSSPADTAAAAPPSGSARPAARRTNGATAKPHATAPGNRPETPAETPTETPELTPNLFGAPPSTLLN